MSKPQSPSPRSADKLLHTKLMAPRLPPTVITRGDLLRRLDDSLTKKLTLVTAPTGFGKTTLVSQWIAERKVPSAWVTLDGNDNDPVRFWTYTITALRTLDAALGRTALSALMTAQPAGIQSVLTALINDLTQLSADITLVLEDYHAITSSEIKSSVAFLLQHLPASFHLILISRNEPDLPLGILRARGELVELDMTSLRFSQEEAEAFLQEVLQHDLPRQAIANLQERTEGWVAGLRLAALSLQSMRPEEIEKFAQNFRGSHRYVADYLIHEVFKSQPETVQAFLLKTCFLNRLTGSLCDAVTGRTDGDVMLEQLERGHLFIVQLQDRGERVWYRYHALFAESIQHFARQRMGEADVQSIYGKASGWYEAHGLYDESIEAALTAGLYEPAMALIEKFIEIHDLTELYTLSRWIESIPEDLTLHNPAMCFAYAQALLYTTDRFAPATAARIEPFLRPAEIAWRAQGNHKGLGELLSTRGLMALWQGDFPKAFEYSRQSLQELPEFAILHRGISLITLCYEALNAGRILDAQDMALEARALLGAARNIFGVLAAIQLLSETFYLQGEMELAEQLSQQILEQAEVAAGESMLDDQGLAFLTQANIAYEQNDLERAEQHARRALELSQKRGNEQLQAQTSIRLAHIHAAKDDLEGAIELVKLLAGRIQNPTLLREIQCTQAVFSIRANDITTLDWWLSVAGTGKNVSSALREREAFTMARLQMAKGKPGEALAALKGWQAEAAEHGRLRSQVEAACLEALAHYAIADLKKARQTLAQALTIGQAKGFRRLFLEDGRQMAALLQTVLPTLTDRSLGLYATTLLHSFDHELVAHQGSIALVEPLSQQELRVLRFLIAGRSNADIAQELFLSINTIKTHVRSIYRKLNIGSRQEARDVARELKLF